MARRPRRPTAAAPGTPISRYASSSSRLPARPAPHRLAPRARTVDVAAEVHVAGARGRARPDCPWPTSAGPFRAGREPRGVRARRGRGRARRRARHGALPSLAPRRPAVQRRGHQHEPAGRERRLSTARSSRSAPASWPPTSGRGPQVSRTNPPITSASHSGEYGWRGRSSESPCSGRSGSTSRKRSLSSLDDRLELAVRQAAPSAAARAAARCPPRGRRRAHRRDGGRAAASWRVGDRRVRACSGARRTTARSSGSPCPRSARSPPSRFTCWSTPRSSATSAPTQLAALAIAATVMTHRLHGCSTSSPTATTAQVARLHGAGRERDAAHARRAGAVARAAASARCWRRHRGSRRPASSR